MVPLDLDRPEVLTEVLRVQRAAYAVEAALIGDDRIPPLHEDEQQLHAAGLRWLGVRAGAGLAREGLVGAGLGGAGLAGALAWAPDGEVVDVHRLVVDPAQLRRGIGRRLVRHLLAARTGCPVVVSTGRDNVPARRLYEGLGFTETATVEVLPGLWVVRYALAR